MLVDPMIFHVAQRMSLLSGLEERDQTALMFQKLKYGSARITQLANEFREKIKRLEKERQEEYATLMPEQGATMLRVVDPFQDEGIWCIVDEGANSTATIG